MKVLSSFFCLFWYIITTSIYADQDTSGTEESVHISEVSLFQGLQELFSGEGKGVLIRELSLFQGLNYMQELFLGKEKVSFLERCPYFRG